MGKKKHVCPAGVPEWVVTFGDMMSLLLTFFILIAAFSELKQDHEYQRVVTAVQEAFGYSGGVGVLPVDDPPLQSMIETLKHLAGELADNNDNSQSDTQGLKGKDTTVSQVHDGLQFTIGGHLTFRPGSAELLDAARIELLKISKLLKGKNNKIEIRGHAARKPMPPGSPYKDLRDLSYYRAKAVANFFINKGDIEPIVLVIDARGDTEPLAPRTYTTEDQAVNRRVEIIQTETLVEDLHPDQNFADPNIARGT